MRRRLASLALALAAGPVAVLAGAAAPALAEPASLTVTVDQGAGQADPTSGTTIAFVAAFSEAVVGFDVSDVTLATTGAVSGSVSAVNAIGPSGTLFAITVDVTTPAVPGTLAVTLGPGAANALSDGRPSASSLSTDNVVTFDNVAPTVTVDTAPDQEDPTSSPTLTYRAIYSEPVVGVTTSAFTVLTLGAAQASVSAVTAISSTVYDVTVTVTDLAAPGTIRLLGNPFGATDLAGNFAAASTSTDNSVTFVPETTRPTVTVEQATGQADPTSSPTVEFTVTFSEPVTAFTNDDLQIDGAVGVPTITARGGGVYDVSVLTGGGTATVSLSVPGGVTADASGNLNLASTSVDNTVTFDTVAPTVSVEQAAAQADPTTMPSVAFDVTFSEPVTGFTSDDVAISGTAPGSPMVNVTGSGAAYRVVVTGFTGSGTVTAAVDAGAASDAVGNASVASTSTDATVSYVVPVVVVPDTTPPTIGCSARVVGFTRGGAMARVRVGIDARDGADGVRVVLASVRSSQRDRGLGRGDRPRDLVGWTGGVDDRAGLVRVERFGRGRTYTWTYRATDAAGNTATCRTRVRIAR